MMPDMLSGGMPSGPGGPPGAMPPGGPPGGGDATNPLMMLAQLARRGHKNRGKHKRKRGKK